MGYMLHEESMMMKGFDLMLVPQVVELCHEWGPDVKNRNLTQDQRRDEASAGPTRGTNARTCCCPLTGPHLFTRGAG